MQQFFRGTTEPPRLEVFRICLGQVPSSPAWFKSHALLGAKGWSGDLRGPFPHEPSRDAVTNQWVYLICHFFLGGQQKLSHKMTQAAACRELPNGKEIEKTISAAATLWIAVCHSILLVQRKCAELWKEHPVFPFTSSAALLLSTLMSIRELIQLKTKP